jgi:hypothetical protein
MEKVPANFSPKRNRHFKVKCRLKRREKVHADIPLDYIYAESVSNFAYFLNFLKQEEVMNRMKIFCLLSFAVFGLQSASYANLITGELKETREVIAGMSINDFIKRENNGAYPIFRFSMFYKPTVRLSSGKEISSEVFLVAFPKMPLDQYERPWQLSLINSVPGFHSIPDFEEFGGESSSLLPPEVSIEFTEETYDVATLLYINEARMIAHRNTFPRREEVEGSHRVHLAQLTYELLDCRTTGLVTCQKTGNVVSTLSAQAILDTFTFFMGK